MSLEPWKNPLGRLTIYMSKTKEGQLSKRPGKIRKEARWIKKRKDSSYLSSRPSLKHINKDS
jgi:hypothetical protein